MKLSEIKGERSLDIIADAMELYDMLADDERVKTLMDDLRDARGDGAQNAIVRVFCRDVGPILRDDRYRERIMSLLAAASGVTPEEYSESGPVIKDLFELITSDAETLGFLLGTAASQE